MSMNWFLYVELSTSHRFKKKVWHALKLFQFQFSFNVFFLPEKKLHMHTDIQYITKMLFKD